MATKIDIGSSSKYEDSSVWYKHPTLLWGILLLGIIVRVVLFFQNRPFFIDEAALASEIVDSNFLEFFRPLDYQFSPTLFSILQKINVLLFGAKEWAFRLWPLLAGIGSLFVFRKLLLRKFSLTTVLFPFALMALGWEFVHYSVEAKQYAVDVFVAALLFYCALCHPWSSKLKSSVGWAVIGAVSIWLSMPSIFVLAAVGIYFVLNSWTGFSLKGKAGLIGVGVFWLINFGLIYQLILAPAINISSLQAFHEVYFFPIPPTSGAELRQAGDILYSFLRTLMGGTLIPLLLGAGLILYGLFKSWKVDPKVTLLFLLPILFAILASGLGKYSLISRLTLFFMPALLFWMCFAIKDFLALKNKWLNVALLVLMLLSLVNHDSWKYFFKKYEVENMPSLLSYVKEQATNEKAYVYYEAKPSFVFYQNYAEQKESYRIANYTIGEYHETPKQIDQRFQQDKMWLILSHCSTEKKKQWLDALLRSRSIEKKIEKGSDAAYLLGRPK